MAKRRPTIAPGALICVLEGWFTAAQEVAAETAAPEDLDALLAGHTSLAGGRRVPVRFYPAPDGTEGQVIAIGFDSLQAAERQITRPTA